MAEIIITTDDYEELKKLFVAASTNNEEHFYFKDAPILTKYAKYLLQYMEGMRGRRV